MPAAAASRRSRPLEGEGLEVGQAPPGLAEAGSELDALAIGGDAFLLPAGGLQRVAIAHPGLRLPGIFGEHAGVHLEGAIELTDAAENRGLRVAVAGVVRVCLERLVDLRERFGGTRLPVQRDREVVACGRKARGELEAALQQVARIGVAAEA